MLVAGQAPPRRDDEGQEHDVESEGDPVQARGAWSTQFVGASSHVMVDDDSSLRVSWQRWSEPTTIELETSTVRPAQSSVASSGAPVVSDHDPGPSRGTMASASEAESSPLAPTSLALSLVETALLSALGAVERLEVPAEVPVVSSVVAGAVVVVAVVVEVVDVGRFASVPARFVLDAAWGAGEAVALIVPLIVVVVVVVLVAPSAAPWLVALDVAPKVKTSTSRSSGLDHTTQCVLVIDRNGLIMLLAG